MTSYQKLQFVSARSCRDECLRRVAAAVLAGNLEAAQREARVAALHESDMLRVVSDAHCSSCGASEGEDCAPTCAYDGPTPSDAMADAGACDA